MVQKRKDGQCLLSCKMIDKESSVVSDKMGSLKKCIYVQTATSVTVVSHLMKEGSVTYTFGSDEF